MVVEKTKRNDVSEFLREYDLAEENVRRFLRLYLTIVYSVVSVNFIDCIFVVTCTV